MLTRFDLDSRLIVSKQGIVHGPYVVQVRTFDDEGLAGFEAALQVAVDAGQEIIPIVIDSDGGSLDCLFAMYDWLDNARAKGCRIATIAIGRAHSAACDLLAAGDRGMRYVTPNARVMVHYGEDGTESTMPVANFLANAVEMSRQYQQSFEIFARNTGTSPKYFQEMLRARDQADWYMTPKEAVKNGIADLVGIPEIVVKVGVEISIGLPKGKKRK